MGLASEKKRILSGRRYVDIIGLELVGNYAVRVLFDDMHDTGIYSWKYLEELGENKISYIRKYIKSLKELGRSRDPRKSVFKMPNKIQ